MMKLTWIAVFIVCNVCSTRPPTHALSFLNRPSTNDASILNVWSTDTAQTLAQSSLKFAWDGYKALEIPSGENVFYSPYSIINALGMLTLGSQGQLEAQLREALRVPSSLTGNQLHQQLSDENGKLGHEKEATIGVANRFFVNKDIVSSVNSEYKADLKRQYKSELEATPFAENPDEAQTLINDFVSEKTHGEITKLLDTPPSPRTILMLINAIYFKGMWTVPFREDQTKSGSFHAKKGDVTANFMWARTSLDYANSPELKAEMVALPYTENRKYAFYVIVANEGQSLESLEARLDENTIRDLGSKLRCRNIELKMPRFVMRNQFELNSMLEKLGATGVSKPQDAQNSRIFNDPIDGSFVDSVIHEAKVEVNENGTVAAGATSIVTVLSSLPFYKPVTLNKPFLFFIMDVSNGFVLFWGRMEDPSSSE